MDDSFNLSLQSWIKCEEQTPIAVTAHTETPQYNSKNISKYSGTNMTETNTLSVQYLQHKTFFHAVFKSTVPNRKLKLVFQ
jgi:hypothetical protein